MIAEIQATKENGIKEVFLVACGGSLVDMYASKFLLESETKELRTGFYTSNEFIYAPPKSLGKNSVTIICSHGGNTPETVEAAQLARELGSATITLTNNHSGNLINYADHSIVYHWGEGSSVEENPMTIILQICVEILNATEDFPYYEQAMDGIKKLEKIVKNGKEIVLQRAKEFAANYENEKLFYTISSGASFGMAYGFSICSLMEMQWVHASAIHSGEFFHGPFEVTDKETPFILLKNEGRTRALDERVQTFLNQYAKKVEVVDAKELGLSVIDENIVEYFNPIVFYCILDVYRTELAAIRNHPLSTRRYMGKVAY